MQKKTILKILVVLFVAYLFWIGFSNERALSPLEEKVEQELAMEQVPARYSDGSWSVFGLMTKTDVKPGDAFMMRAYILGYACPKELSPDTHILKQPCFPGSVIFGDKSNFSSTDQIEVSVPVDFSYQAGIRGAFQIRAIDPGPHEGYGATNRWELF